MAKLINTHTRWEIPLRVIEGGSGVVRGLLTEPDQTQVPAYTFVNPRQILRTQRETAIREGMVVESPGGARFIVGQNGDAELPSGTLWRSFRLYEATDKLKWVRRTTVIDPVTRLEREGEPLLMGEIWCAVEPLDREVPDLKSRTSHEQARFLCGAAVRADDALGTRKVIRAEPVLGMILGVITA